MKEKKVFFNCADIELEGAMTPAENNSPAHSVVVCHPHPQYGGNMDNNVVMGITRILSQNGFTTLRFNFRGAGRSKGAYGNGTEERKDVKAALDFLDGVDQIKDNDIFVVGYSFGAMVGLPVAVKDDRVKGWIGISPPIATYDFDFLKECNKPKLLVCGDSDFVCPDEQAKGLFNSLKGPKTMFVVPDADHFWWGKEETIAGHIKDFLVTLSS